VTAAAAHASRSRLQSALLTLGMTHAHFAHSGEALKALNEAVRTAQQNGDEVSLAHALAAFCSLCASAEGPLASLEGSPAGDTTAGSGDGFGGPGRPGKARTSSERGGGFGGGGGGNGGGGIGGGFEAAEDLRLLLHRCVQQARELQLPHLMAYSDLALARYRAMRPPPGGLPNTSGAGAEADSVGGGGDSSSTAAAAARVAASPPTTTASAVRHVEELHHAVALGAAAPPTSAAAALAAAAESATITAGGAAATTGAVDLYPPPKGLHLSAVTLAAASEAVMEALSGGAGVLFAAVWDAHGVPSMARVCALRHLHCDATRGSRSTASTTGNMEAAAAAGDTAAALASLVCHASVHHGPSAAAEVLASATARFPHDRMAPATPHLVGARARAAHDTAVMRGDAKAAADTARVLAALAPSSAAVDAESHLEVSRAFAHAHMLAGRLTHAHTTAAAQFVAAQSSGLTHATLRATLTLAETLLAAGAPAAALPHALALEHAAAALRLDALRAAAIVVLAEAWLAMSGPPPAWQQQHRRGSGAANGNSDGHTNGYSNGCAAAGSGSDLGTANGYASMARDALDAHMPALLSRGGLALRARARMAAARAVLATTLTVPALSENPAAVLAPLEAAAECCAAAGAVAAEADAHYLRAMTLHALGRTEERNIAARAFRRSSTAAAAPVLLSSARVVGIVQ
jgi:anaphase-promoting complex subunit 5